MVQRYRSQLRARLAAARQGPHVGPTIVRLAIPLCVGVAAYIGLALVLVPGDEVPAFHFVDERGAITALSALFLAAGGAFAFSAGLMAEGSARVVWLLAAAALGFLVLDELLEFHERVGVVLDRMGGTAPGGVRGWNDIVVILYGVVAVPVGLAMLPLLARYPVFVKTITLAFACFVVHTAVDAFADPPTLLSVAVEESAKLFCAAFIALACLSALLVHAVPRRLPEASDAG